ncbi:MAG: IS200/IS605 family transposase [Dehalococcoidia bacterium]|nr:IS200/IS605 family transposase [Dehalococcoidia bacterium]
MKLSKVTHTIYKTQYHIAWITQYRRKILVTGINSYLKIKLQEIRKYYSDWEYIEIGIKKDHVHLYMVIPPKYAVSKVVGIIKKNTSRSLSRKFAFLKKVYGDRKGIWGKGYFVSTVGINEEIIRKYIKLQEKEETGQAKLEF